MSKWLASIQSVEEAETLLPILPSILDMKNPAQGALGAMAVEDIQQVVSMVGDRCLTSATVGDLPMQADVIAEKISQVAKTGVDYVKVGIFPDQQLDKCIYKLALTIKKESLPVIAVMFSDNMPKQDIINDLQQAGFKGVMIDTAFKNGKTLLDHWSHQQLENFVKQVKQQELLCGLAGALRVDDVPMLKQFDAHYLGFRSALCENSIRQQAISSNLARELRELFP